MELKTPLYDTHIGLGGKIVPFGGYLLPVQYEGGVIAEHMAVRTSAGLFDVSHMGEVLCTGKDALANLNYILTNDFTGMYVGQARYSPMCNEAGGTLDDLLVYRLDEQTYMIVVNAGNRSKDVAWMQAKRFGDARFEDISDRTALLALQGPLSGAILTKLVPEGALPPKYYSCTQNVDVAGATCIVSRTGYTGEAGYELYMSATDAVTVWNALLEAGAPEGLVPCGLGARDTLRFEASMPLYGHELDESVTPLEAGLGFAVKLNKDDFIGKAALSEQCAPPRRRAGLKLTGKGIAREHQDVYAGGELVGQTTSGTYCPYLGGAYAMALLKTEVTDIGTQLEVDVRGRRVAAEVQAMPFYKRT